ncbi:MAG: glycine betaine/L-proline ABC transporter ATP-binding protein [Gammaproteobacteria bacterium]|nr:glycine betaine/L-proline ABC transporter ATP-binding protein [Gammaproteobacteria bacterium]
MESSNGDAVIRCRHLWKVFGDRAGRVLGRARQHREQGAGDLDKQQVLEEFGCVLGVVDVSFEVREGEIFCVMGLSGSGKSTLIRHINRLIEPSAGAVFIDGADIGKLSAAALRELRSKRIGMVFQNMALLPHRTAWENVALALEIRRTGRAARQAVAERALESVNLAGWEDAYPDELSGGMQQRVGLARALAADPHILLMDEPFSALDPLIRRQLQDQFLALSRRMKKTTVFITHDLDEAIRIGNRIAIMKDGALVQIGTPEEIVANPADDYVADFVAGISKLHLITAARIMEAVAPGADVAGCPSAPPSADLDALVNLSIDTEHPIVIRAESGGAVLGMVTKKTLLRGIQGRFDEATPASGASPSPAAAPPPPPSPSPA